jgi:flagellar basal-body rod modification protein FlgD
MIGATSLIGRSVTFPGADSTPTTGTVTGAAFDASGPVLVVTTEAGTSASVPLSSITAVHQQSA